MAKIVTDGLIFAYDLANRRTYEGDGGGTSSTDIVGDLTGTITNGAEYLNQNGGVLLFDGTNDYIDFGNDVLSPALPFTLSCWASFAVVDGNDGIFASSWDASTAAGFWCKKSTDNTLNMSYGDNASFASSNRRTKNGTTTLSADVWYHLTFVWRGATDMSIYINGVDDGGSYDGSGGTLDYGSSKPARMATFKNNYTNCKIAQVLIYENGLSADEVVQNYNSARGRFLT